jgi:nitrous oxidase accessory protein NosD
MNVRSVPVLSSALLFSLLCLAFPVKAATQLVVDDDKVQCPNAQFTHIQDAVNAATPGQSIRVCKGTYVEQVSINKPLHIEADSGAILMPSAMQQNATSLVSGAGLAVALLVADANGTSIEGLVVDGTNSGISECSPILFGVVFQNSSGAIDRVTVRNFKLAESLNGCQSGSGIFVQSGGGTLSQVSINKCTVHDFQKNGITANEVGTDVQISGNVVTGIGPTTGAAQNGIQIGFGAGGSIADNTVTNTVWLPCTAVSSCSAVAADILVTQSDGVRITRNTAGIGNVGIFVDGNLADIRENQTFLALVFDGIRVEGNQSQVYRNHVFNGAESGIFLAGNNNVVEDNTITEASIGILKATGSTGNLAQNNHVFGAPIQVQDPSTADVAKLISPVR